MSPGWHYSTSDHRPIQAYPKSNRYYVGVAPPIHEVILSTNLDKTRFTATASTETDAYRIAFCLMMTHIQRHAFLYTELQPLTVEYKVESPAHHKIGTSNREKEHATSRVGNIPL